MNSGESLQSLRRLVLSDTHAALVVQICKVVIAAAIGSITGVAISMGIVFGFVLIILTPVFNIYYAMIFLLIGSIYTFRLFQKNKIQFSMEAEFNGPSHAINLFEEI